MKIKKCLLLNLGLIAFLSFTPVGEANDCADVFNDSSVARYDVRNFFWNDVGTAFLQADQSDLKRVLLADGVSSELLKYKLDKFARKEIKTQVVGALSTEKGLVLRTESTFEVGTYYGTSVADVIMTADIARRSDQNAATFSNIQLKLLRNGKINSRSYDMSMIESDVRSAFLRGHQDGELKRLLLEAGANPSLLKFDPVLKGMEAPHQIVVTQFEKNRELAFLGIEATLSIYTYYGAPIADVEMSAMLGRNMDDPNHVATKDIRFRVLRINK